MKRSVVLDISARPPSVQVVTTVTIEMEGSERPACVAETVRLGFE